MLVCPLTHKLPCCRQPVCLWLSLLLFLAWPHLAKSGEVQLAFNKIGGQITLWQVCYQDCQQSPTPLQNLSIQHEAIYWQVRNPAFQGELDQSHFTLYQQAGLWQLTSQVLSNGKRLRISITNPGNFNFNIRSQWLDKQLTPTEVSPVLSWQFSPSPAFERRFYSGLSKASEKIKLLSFHESNWFFAEDGPLPTKPDWLGFKNRYWLMLIKSPAQSIISEQVVQASGSDISLYLGPMARDSLQSASDDFSSLLFQHLWFWMQWLCSGLLWCLLTLGNLVGNWGIALCLLSVVVKVLMTPLTYQANVWQQQVDQTRSVLNPKIQRLKQQYRGEELTIKIHNLHKQHGVSLFYSVKSLFAVLIQIPVFIAAYHVIDVCFELNGIGFLFIDDLALPDKWIKLPWYIPFFGEYLNLMPLLMSLITVLASKQFPAPGLSAQLKRQQQNQLYLMAFIFFILFQAFPAALVLYWTTNNVLQYGWDLGKSQWQKYQTTYARIGS